MLVDQEEVRLISGKLIKEAMMFYDEYHFIASFQ